MAFSLRSFFGKGGSESTAPSDPAAGIPGSNDPQGASPFTAVAPAPGNAPFSNNLFKTTGPSEPLGQPVASAMLSPFSPVPASQPGITIGDLLSLLPSDVAKNPGLPPTQPVAIPQNVLENALRSGRPVLPLFEVYRACPALFQTPVGPQDVREVPLPAHKIAQLLPQRAPELVGAGSPGLGSLPPSPFGASPFMSGAQTATTSSSPFAMASTAVAEPPAMGTPAESTALFQPSPFTTAMMPEAKPMAASGGGGPTPASSPFTAMANPFVSAPVVTASSPFSKAPAPAAPVETLPVPAAVAPSPFGTLAPPSAPSPEPMPLGSLFGQAPGATEPSAPSPFIQSFGAPAPAGGGFGMPPAAASPFGNPLAPAAVSPSPISEPPAASPFQASPFSAVPQKAPEIQPASVNPFGMTPEAPVPALAADPMKGLFGGPVAPSPFSEAPPSPAPQPFQGFGAGPAAPPAPLPEAPAAPAMPPASSLFPAPPAELPPGSPPAAAAPADLPDNPFARIQAMAKGMPQSPVPAPLAASLIAPAPATLPEEMFAKAPAPPLGAEPFPLPQSFMADLSKLTGKTFPDVPAAIEPPASSPAAASPAGSFSMSLAAALKSCAPYDLGTVPENIQSWVRFTVPMEKIQSQLAAGRVRLPLDEILAGTDPEVRRMFAAARAGLIVDLEMNAVFHALSEGSASVLPPVASPLSPFAPPPAPAPEPFVLPPQENFFKTPEPVASPIPAAPAPEPVGADSPFWGDASNAGPPVSSFMLEPEEPRKPVSPFPAIQAEVPPTPVVPTPQAAAPMPQPSSPPTFAESVVIPANPVTGTPEVISAPPVMPAAAKPSRSGANNPQSAIPNPQSAIPNPQSAIPNPQSAIRNPQSAVAAPAAASSGTNSTRRLLLALLLGSGESEDVGTLMRLTRQLPGVAAAVCLHHGKTLACEGDSTAGADRFLREASANAQLLPSLAALTGIEDSDTLHIQSGHGEATFCLHDAVVLAVLHDPEKREAMLREKITLLGRELAAIVRERETA